MSWRYRGGISWFDQLFGDIWQGWGRERRAVVIIGGNGRDLKSLNTGKPGLEKEN